MKTFRLVEAMEDQLLTCALLSQCSSGPILRVKSSVLSMNDVLRHEKFSWARVFSCLVLSGVNLGRFPDMMGLSVSYDITGLESYKIQVLSMD